MSRTLNLQDYMHHHFRTLDLRQPLFNLAEVGLRFEIAPPEELPRSSAYMEQTYHRSKTLFRELHEPEDQLFLVVNAIRAKRDLSLSRKGVQVFRRFVRNQKLLHTLACREYPYLYAENEAEAKENEDVRTYRYSLSCRVADVNVFPLLQAIANHDINHNYRPMIKDEVYFVNASKHTIFHFYDDRGLDIVAQQKETLSPMNERYKDWILDYDREKIDQVFR